MNSWCQDDLFDMQSEPDGYYRFIMNYQDRLTKFTILRPLKSKTAEKVAYQLMDIFCMFGAPFRATMAANLRTKQYKTWLICGQEWSSCLENRGILKVKDQLKNPTKMFEIRWLLGCPTTRKPAMKDYGLSKARKTELSIQASRQAFMRLCLERCKGTDFEIFRSLKACTVQ